MKFMKISAFLLWLVMAGIACAPAAQASITVLPMIVVMEGRDRFSEVTLVNISNEKQSYELNWKFFSMEEGTGTYINSDKSITPFDLSKNIVFTPRRVTLNPQEPQKVRIALRLNGAPPPPGEYRAHLEFKNIPQSGPQAPAVDKPAAASEVVSGEAGKTPENKTGQKRIRLGIGIHVSYTIPVIYRVGEGDGDAKIGKIELGRNPNTGNIEVYVPLTRTGVFSALGSLTIYHTPAGGGEEKLVGQIRNANVFLEAHARKIKVYLNVKELTPGTLRVVYESVLKNHPGVIDEKKFPVG